MAFPRIFRVSLFASSASSSLPLIPFLFFFSPFAVEASSFVSGGGEYTISGSVPRALNPALITSVIEFAGAFVLKVGGERGEDECEG